MIFGLQVDGPITGHGRGGVCGGGGAYKLGSLKAAVQFTFCGTVVHIVSLVAFMEQIKLIK